MSEFISNKKHKMFKDVPFDLLNPSTHSIYLYMKALLVLKIIHNKIKKYNFTFQEDRCSMFPNVQIIYSIHTKTKLLYLFIEFSCNEDETIDMHKLTLHIPNDKIDLMFNFYSCASNSKKALSKIIKMYMQ